LERTPHQKQVFCKALLETGHSERQAAKLAHLNRDTVAAIAERTTYDIETVRQLQKRLPAKFLHTADWAVSNITPEKMEMCSAPQLMMVAGIAVDKARDMSGDARSTFSVTDVALNLQKAITDSRARLTAITDRLSEA